MNAICQITKWNNGREAFEKVWLEKLPFQETNKHHCSVGLNKDAKNMFTLNKDGQCSKLLLLSKRSLNFIALKFKSLRWLLGSVFVPNFC